MSWHEASCASANRDPCDCGGMDDFMHRGLMMVTAKEWEEMKAKLHGEKATADFLRDELDRERLRVKELRDACHQKQELLDGAVAPLLLRLVENSKFSAADIAAFRELLAKAEGKRAGKHADKGGDKGKSPEQEP